MSENYGFPPHVKPTPMTLQYRLSLFKNAEYKDVDLYYQWLDKPHRHVFDLCTYIEDLEEELSILRRNSNG